MSKKSPIDTLLNHSHLSPSIEEVTDSACDPQVWFALGDHTDEAFLVAMDEYLPSWRRVYSRLTFSSEQTSPSTPAVQHGSWKRAFGKYCDAKPGDTGAFPVTYIRIK